MDFMGITVKQIITVMGERFGIAAKPDTPFEVRPISLMQLKAMGDLSEKIIYILPNYPTDVKTGIFKIYISSI